MTNLELTVLVVHALPGRTRFRLEWLAGDVGALRPIVEGLAAVPGMAEVRARPRTGKVAPRTEAGTVRP